MLIACRGVLPNEEFFHKKLEDTAEVNAEERSEEEEVKRRPGRTLRLQEAEFFRNNPEPPTHVSFSFC